MPGVLAEAQVELGRDDIRSVLVEYKDGASFEGFVSAFGGGWSTEIPVTLTAHTVLRGQDSDHSIRWTDVSRLEITYTTGSVREFAP